MTDDSPDVPERFRRFLPEAPEPTLAEQFDAWLAAQPDDEIEAKRRRTRKVSGLRAWIGYAVPLGMLAAVIAILGWKVLG